MNSWIKICQTKDILPNAGRCAKVGEKHIAIFNVKNGKEWYAVNNVCPHKKESVLSRGIIGDENGEPKVACSLHKNNFSLRTGKHLGGDPSLDIETYQIKVQEDDIYIRLAE